MTMKLTTQRYAWTQFRCAADNLKRQSLAEFIAAGGDSLYQRAIFDAPAHLHIK
ncbi:MAG: hypothetical protein GPOALKHO_001198 [Sodalis sp.]|nr:MAG: hypothetical protein GPOALKHO_001198 [Sodalis sp.]